MKIKIDKEKVIIISLIVIVMITIISKVIKNSYAYYGTNEELEILRATIGDFTSSEKTPMLDKGYDVNIIFYMQEQSNDYQYRVVQNIPVVGYKVNEKKSNCKPDDVNYSDYEITSDGILTLKVKENTPKQIVCRIYYIKDGNSDIVTYALVEDENGTMKDPNGGEKKYKVVNSIPDTNYQYVKSSCSNQDVQTDVIYNESNKDFEIKTTGPNICYAYFDKVS